MRRAAIGAMLATVGVAAFGAAPAQAATQHCEDHQSSAVTKVELGGSVTFLDLAEGTIVCLKVGNRATGQVVVGSDGIHSPFFNRNYQRQAISYYVVYGVEEPPECPDDPWFPGDDDCPPVGS